MGNQDTAVERNVHDLNAAVFQFLALMALVLAIVMVWGLENGSVIGRSRAWEIQLTDVIFILLPIGLAVAWLDCRRRANRQRRRERTAAAVRSLQNLRSVQIR